MLSRSLVRRLLLVPVLVAAGLGGVFAASPAWARSVGLDVWNVSALARQQREAVERRAELTAAQAEISQRIGLKEAVVGELVAGRTTLADATAEFLALNESHPEYVAMIRDSYPGSTDEERTARNVIGYAVMRADNPVEYDRLSRRLDAELQAMLDGRAAQ